jgi:hypothetical protein
VDRHRAGERFDGGKVKQQGACQEGRPLAGRTSRHRRDGRCAPGATKLLGRMSAKQAAIAIAQQGRPDRLGHHGPWRCLGGRPSRHPLPSQGVRGHRISGSAMGNRCSVQCTMATPEREEHAATRHGCGGADGMMSIGRSSRRENLLRVTGCRAHAGDQDQPREPHQGQRCDKEWLHQQA